MGRTATTNPPRTTKSKGTLSSATLLSSATSPVLQSNTNFSLNHQHVKTEENGRSCKSLADATSTSPMVARSDVREMTPHNNVSTSSSTSAAPVAYDEDFSEISFSSTESEIFSEISLLDPVPTFLDSMLMSNSDHHHPATTPDYNDAYSTPSPSSAAVGTSFDGSKHQTNYIHCSSTTPPPSLPTARCSPSRGPLLTSTSIIFKETQNKLSSGFSSILLFQNVSGTLLSPMVA